MAIEFPADPEEVVNRVKSDIQGQLPESNPFLKNSFMQAIATATGFRIFDTYKLAQSQAIQFFPQTATGEFLDDFAQQRGITQGIPTPSSGDVVFSGTIAGTIIPIGNLLSFGDLIFETLENGTLSANNVSVLSLTQTAGLATLIFNDDHNLATGVNVTISGANQVEYNGVHTVTVISNVEITFSVLSTTTSPATGTIVVDYNVATVKVQSQSTGVETNVSSGGVLALQNPILNVNNNAFVALEALTGGEDEQSEESYRTNILQAFQNPLALFNESAITQQAQLVDGVTRVFVMRATDGLDGAVYKKDQAGFVTIFFVQDEQTNIIPSGSAISAVKDSLLLILPSDKVEANVIVLAPSPVVIPVTFTSILPDTATMKTAIIENINSFFSGSNGINGVETFNANNGDILINNLTLAIGQTVDTTTGQQLASFVLSTPTTNIVISDGKIAVVGTITIP